VGEDARSRRGDEECATVEVDGVNARIGTAGTLNAGTRVKSKDGVVGKEVLWRLKEMSIGEELAVGAGVTRLREIIGVTGWDGGSCLHATKGIGASGRRHTVSIVQ